MRISILTIGIILIGTVAALALNEANENKVYSWRYKMIVTVETPEGEVTGSAVRQMGNDLHGSPLSQQGNPAEVKGEAVVVDLGERGKLFALISHQSDLEFYNAFPVPGKPRGSGGSTPEGIKYYASLPIGTKGTLNPQNPPGYPRLVTFTDMDDPKSVTLAQEWTRRKDGYFELTNDHMEELFGKGIKLKNIALAITDEPVTWGEVDEFLPSRFHIEVIEKWRSLPYPERERMGRLTTFKKGEHK